MALATDYPPLPGTWTIRAQDALDALSSMRRLDEVAEHFGTGRLLVEAVLGAPVTGGVGTRRAIRATGALLQHRLGPALAAEALSWAASVAEAVDSSTIEMFLEAVADADVTHRPLRLEDRNRLVAHLEGCRTEGARRQALSRLWSISPDEVTNHPPVPEDDYWQDDTTTHIDWEDIEAWLNGSSQQDEKAPIGPRTPTMTDLYRAESSDEQVVLFGLFSEHQRSEVAAADILFDLAQPIIERCLLEHTGQVLKNRACPDGLRERVRHPYDEATLELAVRAGSPHYEIVRVHRLLADLNTLTRVRLLAEIPYAYLAALRVCGLNRAEELLHGHLAEVDLSSRTTAKAVLGTADNWHWRRLPENVVEVLIHHSQARHLTWTLAGRSSGNVMPDLARRLVREACPEIAGIALRYMPSNDLIEQDAKLALLSGAYWTARCAGISASDRPHRSIPSASEWWWIEHEEPWFDDLHLRAWYKKAFVYPDAIDALQLPYPEAPGWTVGLPTRPTDLERNARAMHNCTRAYASDVWEGTCYILIVHDPQGCCFNVAVFRTAGTYQVGEINSRNNDGCEPAWIRPAVMARLVTGVPTNQSLEPAPPGRPARDRRDRRRTRATRARRLRR